ncbi:hypothetical protein Pfo_015337 [Paulownia fortunei]|nr:hypothetical protein Pfo_015337 [Paulownia fortunei]
MMEYLQPTIVPSKRSPFTTAILVESLAVEFKVANLVKFDGIGDPQEHLDNFFAKANLYDLSDAVFCKVFQTTLTKRALSWFNQLPAGSIANFEQLMHKLLHQFSINRKHPKTVAYLFLDFVMHFIKAAHRAPYVNHKLLAGIMQQNLRYGRFKESIAGKPPSTLEELLARAEKYIRIEETVSTSQLLKRKHDEERPEGKKEERIHAPPAGYNHYASLKARMSEILVVVEQRGLVQPSRPMKKYSKR